MAKAAFEAAVIPILDDPDTSDEGQMSQIQRFDALIQRFDPDYPSEEPHPYIDHFIYEHDDMIARDMALLFTSTNEATRGRGQRYYTPLMRACFRKKPILAYHIFARSSYLDRDIPSSTKPKFISIRAYCDSYINISSEIYQQVKTLHNHIINGRGAEVARLIGLHPYLLNIPYGDGFTPLIAVCWALNLETNDSKRRVYNQIARFLLSQPTIDVLRYRVRRKSLKACYYCESMDADVLKDIVGRDVTCKYKPYAREEEEPAAAAAPAPPAASRGVVQEPAPLPPRRSAGAAGGAGAAPAAAAAANNSNSGSNWEEASRKLDPGKLKKGGRRRTVKKSKQQKRRYRKSQKRG